MSEPLTAVSIARIREFIGACERAVKPSPVALTPLLRRDGVIMELTTRDDFGVLFTGGRHFSWAEVEHMEIGAISSAMRYAVQDLFRTVHATTE